MCQYSFKLKFEFFDSLLFKFNLKIEFKNLKNQTKYPSSINPIQKPPISSEVERSHSLNKAKISKFL